MKKLIILLSICFAACSTPQVAPPTGLEGLRPGVTGVILPLTLSPENGAIQTNSCTVKIKSTAQKEFSAQIAPGAQIIFIEAPAGTYYVVDLNCGKGQNWDFTSKNWPPIFVMGLKISIAAPMDFRINTHGGMTTFFSNRNSVQSVLREIFSKLQSDTGEGVISAYNRKPVTKSMAKLSEYQITVKLPPHHAKEGEPDEANYPDFKSCYAGEFSVNPLYAGSISIGAKYKDKAYKSEVLHENQSAYSDQFYNCVEEGLRKFIPNRSDELNYEIVL